MKHTRGPWVVNYTKIDGAIVRWHIAGPQWGSAYPICEHTFEGEPYASEQEANASLIAAAPELLFALELLYEHTKNNHTICDTNETARLALAKAKGETP